jgi:hypothetical protein
MFRYAVIDTELEMAEYAGWPGQLLRLGRGLGKQQQVRCADRCASATRYCD